MNNKLIESLWEKNLEILLERYSQTRLAEIMGVHTSSVGKWIAFTRGKDYGNEPSDLIKRWLKYLVADSEKSFDEIITSPEFNADMDTYKG